MKSKPRTRDPETGMAAMKTIKITVTDEDGVILDRTVIDVEAGCSRLAFRPIEGTAAEQPCEQILTIGI
jgi:hypothetical protein